MAINNLNQITLPTGTPKGEAEFQAQFEGAKSYNVTVKIWQEPEMKWYQCANCGNKGLSETRPDNSECGGCDKPDFKLMYHQQAYKTGDMDWLHIDGEI